MDFEISIKSNNSNAINNIGIYHNKIIKNYDEMKKYYLMAIDLNNKNAMHNLGCYYEKIEKNYPKMKKYYLMAIIPNTIKNCTKYKNRAFKAHDDHLTPYSKIIL
jgi:TPR repeat protein